MFIVDQQLNIDPTDEDKVIFKVITNGTSTSASIGWTNGTINYSLKNTGDIPANAVNSTGYVAAGTGHGFSDNGKLLINFDTTSSGTNVLVKDATDDDDIVTITTGSDTGVIYLVFTEDADNTGTFSNVDDNDDANLDVLSTAKRGTTATFDYNDSAQSFIVANDFGTIDMDESSVGAEWNSGEELTVTLRDQDLNKNTGSDEDLTMALSDLIPSIQIGSPIMIGTPSTGESTVDGVVNATKQAFSNIRIVDTYSGNAEGDSVTTNLSINMGQLVSTLTTAHANTTTGTVYTFINYDVASLMTTTTGITLEGEDDVAEGEVETITATSTRGLLQVRGALTDMTATSGLVINFTGTAVDITTGDRFYVDIFTFGDGTAVADRTNNAIYRMELEETDDNTGEFTGSVEYIMLNQLNVDVASTFANITPTSDEVVMIVHEDLTDEDSPRVNYNDKGADGVITQIADQVAAPSHSGVVSFDSANYKTADTVVVTLDDQDLNVDSDLVDVYITKSDNKVGNSGSDHILDITFDDSTWTGLAATDFTLVETEVDSGIFVGSFQIPSGQTGKDIEVNYNDHRDASGETIEVGAGAAVNANTGSVAFDRTVYPVPWGNVTDATNGNLTFDYHASAELGDNTDYALAQGDVVVHVRVTDADYNVSASGEDTISDTSVIVKLERGSNSTIVATVGDSTVPMTEVSPDSGVFEYDVTIDYNDGVNNNCPTPFTGGQGCVLQGDIITVEYTDLTDASGQSQTVTDSATFDLRNGVLQSDKSVYLVGSDMILTLIEPDFDRDNDGAESYSLDLIEWDSDAATTTMGDYGVSGAAAAFDPEPSSFRETGDSTGIFQVVIEIPETLNSQKLDRGETIDLEYTDWGPAGADYVGQEDEDIGLTVYTSNFGATIELDQKYTHGLTKSTSQL
jgi:hypothetical protein